MLDDEIRMELWREKREIAFCCWWDDVKIAKREGGERKIGKFFSVNFLFDSIRPNQVNFNLE